MGVSAGDVVVRLGGVKAGADALLEFEDSWDGRWGQPGSELLAGLMESVERGEGVTDHGLEVERSRRLIQRPERFGTVRIELRQLLGMRLREVRGWYETFVESTEKGERIQPRPLKTGAEVSRDEGRAPRRHGSRMV
jgi:hypothetical protein